MKAGGLIALVLAAAALAGCPKARGGKETEELEAVGALLLHGRVHCTGAVIGRQTVLTAAHCLEDCSRGLVFAIGPHATQPRKTFAVRGCAKAPGYDPTRPAVHDLGVAYLGEDFTAAPPMAYKRAAVPGPLMHARIELFGYGHNDDQGNGLGTKRIARSLIRQESATTFVFGGGGVGACGADSGGPILRKVGGSYELVGTTSWEVNPVSCGIQNLAMRIDAYTGWLDSVVQ